MLHPIDLLIIGLYLLATVVIGVLLQRRAARNLDSYFLGGRSLPWPLLGLSNASGMFDISGTMWMVSLAFVYGLKSVWIPWLWPVFNQIFLMMYLSTWLRRSGVMTGAEWIRKRFGDGPGGRLSHLIVVLFAVIGVVGFLSYGFVGIGKFIEIFLPWGQVSRWVPWDIPEPYVPHFYGVIFTSITTLYVVLGGMLSVVWADLVQFTIMTVSAVVVGVIAMNRVSPDLVRSLVPDGWFSPFFGWQLGLDWGGLLPAVNDRIRSDGCSLFGLFFMMMLFKGVFAAMAGPAPNYDMQKILSTRSPAEAAKMSGFVSVVLLFPRYIMITGFAVLALVFFRDTFRAMGSNLDFEQVLPMAIREFVPVGARGLLLAGLFAAFMGTFAATVNAAPAYLVNDVYLRYLRPQARGRHLIHMSYAVCIGVVALSTVVGFFVPNINSILQWIVSALYGGYIAANVLKWHWWRFNGEGYFWGMLAGILSSMVFPLVFRGIQPLFYFPITLAVSVAGCILGTYSAPPTDKRILMDFYRTTRPWGFWKPIHDRVTVEDPGFEGNPDFRRDTFNVAVGIVWQTCLTLTPIYLVLKQGVPMALSMAVLIGCSLILKRTWYDRLALPAR